MSIRKKLTLHFIVQFFIVGFILFILSASLLFWLVEHLNQIEIERDFGMAGLKRITETMIIEDGKISFDPNLLEQVKKSGGWLQAIDEQGRVIAHFNVPDDVPNSYSPGELNAYWLKKKDFPYDLYLWISKKNNQLQTVIYGIQEPKELWIEQIAAQGYMDEDSLQIPDEFVEKILATNGWVQLIDHKGLEIASFNKPEQALQQYSPQELALRLSYPERYNTQTFFEHSLEDNHTWVLSFPNIESEIPRGEAPRFSPEGKMISIVILLLLFGSMLTFLLLSIWYAWRFGAPILHVMDWINALKQGSFKEPTNKSGRPKSKNKHGKLRYKLFRDLIQSLSSLSKTLEQNEVERTRTRQAREEWIEGVSHDMKTPLSSIRGYAHLLESEKYEWSYEEIREFGQIILQKSIYIDNLVNDLNLTYRFKNGGTPPETEIVELNQCLAEAIDRTIAHPRFRESKVTFERFSEPIQVNLFKPWIQRIVDNLIANAILHNPVETEITIKVEKASNSQIVIHFRDNGDGMDEDTALFLFERYYKGTNTESTSEGSGLGMAVTKALVEALRGTLKVDTMQSKGTVIQVYLPIPNEERES